MRVWLVDPASLILLALLILIVPLKWCVAAFLAAALHELCHYLAVRLCGGRVESFRFSSSGAVMEAGMISDRAGLFCTLAGPAGGALLLALLPIFPRIALCALVFSAYNLLPLPGLDGGNALKILSRMVLSERAAELLCGIAVVLCRCAIAAAGIYGTCLAGLGPFPLILSVLVLLRTEK